jgi:hypothetical protein
MHFNALMHELGALGEYTFLQNESSSADLGGTPDATPSAGQSSAPTSSPTAP